MRNTRISQISVVGIFLLTFAVGGTVLASGKYVQAPPGVTDPRDPGNPRRTPAPSTVDRIAHTHGNLATTVDNFGLVGGWSYYGMPSGEWPRGSGRSYLAEINYWMGAVTAAGDTLVVNTWDECQGMSALGTDLGHAIMLSTDTSRYYNFDPADTVGAGFGNPARGWRTWNAAEGVWDYTQNYSSLDTTFYEGGPVSGQMSHYRFDDAAGGTSLMGIEVSHSVLQWNYCYNKDFLFVILEITNNSGEDYQDFAFGLYTDIDVGGWDDETGENGRLGDLVGYDSLENLAWIYDEDGKDPAWGPLVTTGFMGTKYLETPEGIGMTAFRSGQWDSLPDEDPGRYLLINGERYDESTEPYDQYYIQCTRGIEFDDGETIRVVYALIAGADEAEFRENAARAQVLYDNFYVGPEPPTTPTLTAAARDGKVYLYWNDAAQTGVDPLSGEHDFRGYKLYRSIDNGQSWGGEQVYNTDNACQPWDWQALAEYAVMEPTDPIRRSYIDTGLVNGIEYWYCLVAYDTGASASGIDALQSGFGAPGSSTNTVLAIPRTDPAGYLEAADTAVHVYAGTNEPSAGTCLPTVYDRPQLLGADYKVTFEDTPEQTFWHLINVTTGDTLLDSQTHYYDDPEAWPVVEGLRVVLRNADPEPRYMEQTAGDNINLVLDPESYYGNIIEYFAGSRYGDAPVRATYELRFSDDSTIASAYNDNVGYGMAWSIPFECWNTSTNQRVALSLYDFGLDGYFDPWDLLIIIDYPYDPATDPYTTAWPYFFSWMFGFDYEVYNPSAGDVFTVAGPLLNSPEDEFLFSVGGVNNARARAELAQIRVVPDPYYAISGYTRDGTWEARQGERELQFQHLPDQCTVRIYSLAGDLVRTIEHADGSGTVAWNLLTDSGRLIASGIYIYHVESRFGDHLGRFAVVE